MDLGLACHVCGTLNALGAQTCSRCGAILAAARRDPPPSASGTSVTVIASARPSPAAGATVVAPSNPNRAARRDPMGDPMSESVGDSMSGLSGTFPGSGAHNRGERTTGIPDVESTLPGNTSTGSHAALRFDPATGDGLMGGPLPAAKTMFFGALQQQPVVPRLVVIKGEGGDGATYHLQGTTTVIGRVQGDITFAEDPFLSPEHARFTGQHGRLFVQDLDSENGVFLRIKKPTLVGNGTRMLVGEQLLRLQIAPFSDGSPTGDGTYYYGSPRPSGRFQVVQCLAGGGEGRIATAEDGTLSMGREGNTLNFPDDRFISGHHARLDAHSDSQEVMLTDTGSRNGTFIRLVGAQELFHGDYLFVGQQLLRVEIA